MKRVVSTIGLVLILVISLTACSSNGLQAAISKELGVDVSGGVEISVSDTHGGFHGDGLTCVALRFSDDSALAQIRESERWNRFPLDETAKALAYGVSDETASVGPFLTDNDGEALLPEIQNGYYLLLDRQAKPGKAAGADMLQRSSLNFTLAIYDAAANILYFCKLDT